MFHPTLSKSGRIAFFPLIVICKFLSEHCPAVLIQIRHFFSYGRFVNIRHPRNLTEKILYEEVYTDTSKWTLLADKYKVRDYIIEKGLESTLVQLYGHWYNLEDFKKDFYSLPESFILKANNGDGKGTFIIVKNKSTYDNESFEKICNTLKSWLNNRFISAMSGEPQYKGIKPCIIAEQLLTEDGEGMVTDYKFWCFNGTPLFVNVFSGRSSDGSSANMMSFDRDWNIHTEYLKFGSDYKECRPIAKPENLDKMFEIASVLSMDFPLVRVDLYNINGKIFFGELTFTPSGGIGLTGDFQQEYLDYFGKLINVERLPKK